MAYLAPSEFAAEALAVGHAKLSRASCPRLGLGALAIRLVRGAGLGGLLHRARPPLLERNPEAFWKGVGAIASVVVTVLALRQCSALRPAPHSAELASTACARQTHWMKGA